MHVIWPRGDTKFLIEVLKNISRVSAANERNIFSTRKNTKPFHSNSFLVWKARFIM